LVTGLCLSILILFSVPTQPERVLGIVVDGNRSWEHFLPRAPRQSLPKHYNLTVKPTAEDFKKGTVEIPTENVIPLPGRKA